MKLNSKKLYSSDGYCVQELLKISDILYKAKKSVNSKEDYEYSTELDITSRKQDITQIKILSSEIVETGLNLLDLLEKEKSLKDSREKAIEFLDNISKGGSSGSGEQEQIEKRIISILQNQQNTLDQLDVHVTQLSQTAMELEEDIKMKQIEYERAEKRLESLNNAKPAHFNELKQLEAELSHIYRIYVEKIRNHDFLANQLETYHKIEEESKYKMTKALQVIQDNIRKQDERAIHDDGEELNVDYENNDEFENYQQDALNKNVYLLTYLIY